MSFELAMGTRSIFIESREWFDKSGGNSYFSSRLWVNGQLVHITEMTYGYETAHIHDAIEKLIDLGYLLPEWSQPYAIRACNIDLYIVKSDVLKRDLFKKEEN